MSGLEIIGLVFGIVGFLSNSGHLVNKVRKYSKEKRAIREGKRHTQKASEDNGDSVAVIETATGVVGASTMTAQAAFELIRTLGVGHQSSLQSISAEHFAHNTALLGWTDNMLGTFVRQFETFSLTLHIMTITVIGFSYLLGHARSENKFLRRLNFGLSSAGVVASAGTLAETNTKNNSSIASGTEVVSNIWTKVTKPKPVPTEVGNKTISLTKVFLSWKQVALDVFYLCCWPFEILYWIVSYPANLDWFPDHWAMGVKAATAVFLFLLITLVIVYHLTLLSPEKKHTSKNEISLWVELRDSTCILFFLVFFKNCVEDFPFGSLISTAMTVSMFLMVFAVRLRCRNCCFICCCD